MTRNVDWWEKLMRNVIWLGKSIDEESWLTRKVDWQWNLIDEENRLARKVDWQGKLMSLGFDDMHGKTTPVVKVL